ncbi:hypothetical protein GQ54DRAFT_39826 [Martensiomyces pterosporus]|nr:hypothetical protein GQ54DRAFT_39826 [Martensiomyces pterosporus]
MLLISAWMTPENLEPYEQNLAKFGSKAKNRKDPSFADALKQAQDPSIADEIIKRSLSSAAADGDEDEDEDEDEEPEEEEDEEEDVGTHSADSDSNQPTRAKPVNRKAQSSSRSKKAAASKKRTNDDNSSSEDDGAATATPKRSRTTANDEETSNGGSPAGNGRGGSDDSRNEAKDSPHSRSPSARHSPEHHDRQPGHAGSKDDPKHDRSGSGSSKSHQHLKNRSKTYQLLMQLRHRLQKTIIKGPLPDDLTPVHDVFRKLEEFDMTLELIQETKLGKVMRVIAGSDRLRDAPEEKFDIKGRARRLAEKWRRLIVKRREGSTEPTAPESPRSKPDGEGQVDSKAAGDSKAAEPASPPPASKETESSAEPGRATPATDPKRTNPEAVSAATGANGAAKADS